METFFIGDTHFYHCAIINYCNRPFTSVEEMNETIVKNWNNRVGKHDVVFMLGDFALCGRDRIIELGNRLHGRKTLILGNHDGASMTTYREAGFELIYKYPVLYDGFYILSHTPQFTAPNGLYVNIHAHIHNNPKYKSISPLSYCTSVELNDYAPIEFGEIKERICKAREESDNIY